jgi:hypothetical protein
MYYSGELQWVHSDSGNNKKKEKLMEGMPEIYGLNHAVAKLFQGHPEIWGSTLVVL